MIRAILIVALLSLGTPVLSQTPETHVREALPRVYGRPLVIAHRGASAERPEHTASAYDLAIDQGADVIEPDLVMTRDGMLVARHENEIGGTTDVASHPAFAARRVTRLIDGESVTGWFTEDFTLAELKTLRARERLPKLRPGNTAHDGQDSILTFQEVIDIARAGSLRTGRTIGLAPELKHPSHFQALGLTMEDAFVAVLSANGLTEADAPVWVQCFEVGPLERLNARIDAPLLQLIAADTGPVALRPADRPGLRYAEMITADGLARIAAYADAVGVESTLVIPRDTEGRSLPATTLVSDAHAAGLKVVVWTLRPENVFLPQERRRGDDPAAYGDMTGLWTAFAQAGIDAIFTDLPGAIIPASPSGSR